METPSNLPFRKSSLLRSSHLRGTTASSEEINPTIPIKNITFRQLFILIPSLLFLHPDGYRRHPPKDIGNGKLVFPESRPGQFGRSRGRRPRGCEQGFHRWRQVRHLLPPDQEPWFGGHQLKIYAGVLAQAVENSDQLPQVARNEIMAPLLGSVGLGDPGGVREGPTET